KMSKSLGNVVRPLDMKARYGMDAVRYYLLRDMAFGQDAEFSEATFVARLNGDLANGLGNLASRVLRMQQSYFQGLVQPRAPEPVDEALREAFSLARRELERHVAELAFHRALEALWRALDHANRYVTETAPFTLAKDPPRRPRGRAPPARPGGGGARRRPDRGAVPARVGGPAGDEARPSGGAPRRARHALGRGVRVGAPHARARAALPARRDRTRMSLQVWEAQF